MELLENVVEENRRLRRTMRDLIALSSLPAVWIGLGPDGIVRSVAGVLLDTLALELVYIRLAGPAGEGAVEVIRSKRGADAAHLDAIRSSLTWLPDRTESPATIPDPFSAGTLHVVVTHFGAGEDEGVLVTGSLRTGFPAEQDRVLLGVGANQVAIVLQRWRAEERLRQSEARKSAILETALDCIVTMDADGKVIEFNPAAERTFGYRRADVVGRDLDDLIIPPTPGDSRHRGIARYLATGEASVLGKRIELSALRADTTEFPVELAIARIPTDPPLFTAYVRDISERNRHERLRNARLAVTETLSQAATAAEAATGLLRAVCEGLGWDAGFFWTLAPGGDTLRLLQSWRAPDVALTRLETLSLQRTFRRGDGLPGHVWAIGEPTWLSDVVKATHFPRAASAAKDGLHGAFACPLVVGTKTLGVIEFFSHQIRQPDADLLEMMGTVAGNVAQFLERKTAEEKIRRSEQELADFFDNATVGLHWVGPDGTILRANRAELDMLGYRREEYVGRSIVDFHADSEVIGDILYRLQAGEELRAYPARLQCKNGLVKDVLIDSNVFWRNGEFVHTRCFTRDVTAWKLAERSQRESEEKLRLLADTIPQLAWMAHPDGSVFWFNRRWYEYTGTTLEQVKGSGWQSVHDPQLLPEVLTRWNACVAGGEPFDMVLPLKGADGEFRPFLTRVNPLRDDANRILYWFGTNTDISDLKRMEDALRDADRRKDEFLATLANELRNPLAPIRNGLQILKMTEVDAGLAGRTRDVMERQVDQLVRLVDDLLDVSRVMRGKVVLRKEPVELATVVNRAVETAQPLIDLNGHDLDVSLPCASLVLNADPIRLSQVMGNLLTNAAKYTEAGGRISLSARSEAGAVVLRVKDTGIGIATDVLPHVFELFVQGDHSATRAQAGLGIGLTLVKNLVEMHDGSVEVYSAGPGRGCEFVVRLPQSIAKRPALSISETCERQQEVAPSGLRLLVVDNNEDAATALAMLLRLKGHKIRVVHDGNAALEAVQVFRPALVLLDIGMPGMDGYEVARRIRSMPGLESVVLAAVTGWGQQEDRRRSAEAGFDHHLVKPPEPQALENLLAATLLAQNSSRGSGGGVSHEQG